jgi:hypothetical protein
MPPLTTLALPVEVQVQRNGGACWQADFATARVATSSVVSARVK